MRHRRQLKIGDRQSIERDVGSPVQVRIEHFRVAVQFGERWFQSLAVGRADLERRLDDEIGSASCRERVCQYVEITVVARAFKKNNITTTAKHTISSKELYNHND